MDNLFIGSFNSVGTSITNLNVANITATNLNIVNLKATFNIINTTFTNVSITNSTMTNLNVTNSTETNSTIGTLNVTTTTIGSLSTSLTTFLQGTTMSTLNLVESGSTTSITYSTIHGTLASLSAGSRLTWIKIGSILFLSGSITGTAITSSNAFFSLVLTLPNSYTHSLVSSIGIPGSQYCWFDNNSTTGLHILSYSPSTTILIGNIFNSSNVGSTIRLGFYCAINL